MIKIPHVIRQTFSGLRTIDNALKYRTMGLGLTAAHFFFMVVFGVLQVRLMFWYNLAITVYYFFITIWLVEKERFMAFFLASFSEILLHSAMASVLLGWSWGFMLYTIALIPVGFYFCYTLPHFKENIKMPIVSATIVLLCFVAVRIVTWHADPLYTGYIPIEMPSFFYMFNTMITYVMLLFFSILFSLEIRYMQRQLEQENRTLGQIANYDPLTHLSNRRSMNNHLKSALESAEETGEVFCLVMADIDNFKKVNDTYGHECGDEILIRVSNIISENIREQDNVCRWGGEEMLLLLKADLDNARKVAERICREVEASVVSYKDTDVRVTLTLGVAEYEPGATIRTIIGKADNNLYHGKNNGKNQVVC